MPACELLGGVRGNEEVCSASAAADAEEFERPMVAK